ncbi:hypothetical protein GTY65_29875 [Streptomyces sp. SID8379]|uniref:hypothetical protein n=1 Tax=unclassified Streptomyces TaxID=2593676 RepID=UPI00035D4BEE|nr:MULTISPECIES: hypothetical protein [unclassified Streptomyces]MYW68250.1 hypothetical protein [Streptomyces sp. SID8379]
MTVVVRRTVGAAAATALLCTGAVACSGGSDQDGAKKASSQSQGRSQISEVLTAAYKKTSAAKSAKVEMTMKTPAAAGGGGTMKMSGTMGWDPTVMDMTMSGSALTAGDADAPESVRMVWQDDVMYMDMGAKAAKDMDGKRWMKMDLGAIAKQAGDEKAASQMTGGLDNMNQDPAKQIAMLLDSPNLKHIGSATVDGVKTQHYKGTLTVDEMVAKNDSLKVLGKSDRDKLLKNVEKAGIKDYDTELWVSEDDLPVRMDVTMDSAQGAVEMSQKFSDYGAAVKVDTPPASQTFDLMEMLKEMGAGASAGASAGTSGSGA